jgi:hypothetical protein
MITHYISVLGSTRVSKLIADLPEDDKKVFENTITELREALSPGQQSATSNRLGQIKVLTEIVTTLKTIEDLARKKKARSIFSNCPHCEGKVHIGIRSDDTLFLAKALTI